MGINQGFDIVPKLHPIPKDIADWGKFLDRVKQKYKNDPLFELKTNQGQNPKSGQNFNSHTYDRYEFNVGEHPTLPLDGSYFLSFQSKTSGSSYSAFEYIQDVFNIAKSIFRDRAKFWNDCEDCDGPQYNWTNYYDGVKIEVYPMFARGNIIQDFVDPFMKVLAQAERDRRCHNCFKITALQDRLHKCAKCLQVNYCGKACQKEDWKNGHAMECTTNIFQEKSTNLKDDSIFQVLRTLGKLNKQPDSLSQLHYLYSGTPKTFMDLFKTVSDIGIGAVDTTAKEIWSKLDTNMHRQLPDVLIEAKVRKYKFFRPDGETDEPDSWEKMLCIQRLITLWQRYAVEIRDDNDDCVVGYGIYIQGSFMLHSCRPDAVRVIMGAKMQIRCIETMKDYVPATVSFISNVKPLKQRQSILKLHYGINCFCSLCREELTAATIDYKKLSWILKLEERETEGNFTFTLGTFFEVSAMLSKVMHNFDERLTRFRVKILQKLMRIMISDDEYQPTLTDESLMRFGKSVLLNAFITFGKDHAITNKITSDFTQFKKKMDTIKVQEHLRAMFLASMIHRYADSDEDDYVGYYDDSDSD